MGRVYNVIDADGHILEPLDLWENYIDPAFRDRAPRIMKGENGKERLVIEEQVVGDGQRGIGRIGAVGARQGVVEADTMAYKDGKPGGFDPHKRIPDMDADGIDAAFLYPSLGLFSGAIHDPKLAAATCRAYNRWLADYCRPYPDRLFGVAMLPLQDVDLAIKEMTFARKELGMRGGFIRPNPYNETVIHHPDVRRSLMTQKAYSEGLRALLLYSASVQDTIESKEGSGGNTSAERALNDLLLPVVKGYGSEKSYALLAESLQCFGGSGYLQDYPMEQYVRDAKIDTLYEGTTAIQGMDLFFRKMLKDGFEAITALGHEIQAFAMSDGGGDALTAERAALGGAMQDVQSMIETMASFTMASAKQSEEIYRAGLNTTRLLFAVGDVIVAWLLLRSAVVALSALSNATASDADNDFYRGKVASARWFCAQVLPHLRAERKILEGTTLDAMELPESSF